MSRKIRPSREEMKELTSGIMKRIMDELGGLYPIKSKISLDIELPFINDKLKKKARVLISEKAWVKMRMLVLENSTEVAWHGTARRGNKEGEYVIDDIIIYPQVVTGVTADTDQEEYQNWLISQPEDVFNNIRMQGHSHVNMGVTPSAVDRELYRKLLSQLGPDMFYIFLINNKKGDWMSIVMDIRENVHYEGHEDVEISVVKSEDGVFDLMEDSRTMVNTKTRGYEPPLAKSGSAWGDRMGVDYGKQKKVTPKETRSRTTKKGYWTGQNFY